MKIFHKEIEDGISDAVAVSDEILTQNLELRSATIAAEQSVFSVPAELGSDVMRFHSILVTTNWNRNDDVFSPGETWLARKTPVGKPVNLNHEGREIDWRTGKPAKANRIIGCMVACTPVNESYEPISNDDEVPDKYHLLVASNIWEYLWPTAAKQIKKGIDSGTLYVSMESKFASFGYAIRKEEGAEITLIPRNDETAELTKHLRKFKGTGKAVINGEEYLIGRWLRDITFVGMGIVSVPGNLESIIFDDYVSHAEKIKTKVDLGTQPSVLLNSKKDNKLWLI